MSKTSFKQWLYDQWVCKVKHYHDDNGIFSEEMFWHDCKEWQSQSFSSVGAQHQNAHAEHAIQNIMYMARTMFMVHASLHWTERVSDDLSLWSFTGKIFGTGL